MKTRLGGMRQNDPQVVMTCTVHFSSGSEVSRPQPMGQIQSSEKFCKYSLSDHRPVQLFTYGLWLLLHYISKFK